MTFLFFPAISGVNREASIMDWQLRLTWIRFARKSRVASRASIGWQQKVSIERFDSLILETARNRSTQIKSENQFTSGMSRYIFSVK
jgi:hypothetical protein